jgi:tRNA (guanine6-N2)-methyltransferase
MPYRPRVDLDREVHDRLILRTAPGAVDYLFEEVRALDARVLRREPDGLVVEYRGPLRPLAGIRYFDVLAVDLAGLAGPPGGAGPAAAALTGGPAAAALTGGPAAAALTGGLDASMKDGVLAALLPDGPVRFRVGRLGADRWTVRDRLVADHGWVNSPDAWDVNIEPGGAEIGGLFLTQRFGELLRTPASTNPVVAAVMVRLAKIEPGQTVVDPFCGAGTLLVYAAEMARPGRLLGLDAQARWLRMAAGNLARRGHEGGLVRADAAHLPVGTGAADRVVANLPFGKRVGSHRVNADLYPAALAEIARVLPGGGRAVLLTDDKRLFRETVQRTRLVRVVKEIMLARGGLHPSAYVLVKRGR